MVNTRKLLYSFHYAFAGIRYAATKDQNLRIHFFAAIIVILLGVFFQLTRWEWSIVGLVILFVICTEMLNSALEQIVDLITTEHRKEAEIAKDLSAGMVLLSAIGSVAIGLVIFVPYITKFLFN